MATKKAQDTGGQEMTWVFLTDKQGWRTSKDAPLEWYGPGEVQVPVEFAKTLNQSPVHFISGDNLIALQLLSAGYDTEDKIRAATDKELLQIEGVGPVTLQAIRQRYGDKKAVEEVSNG